MALKRITILATIIFLLASCATGKDKAGPTPLAGEQAAKTTEPFSLPEVPEPEEKAEQQGMNAQDKADADMQAVLIEKSGLEQYIILNFENTDIKTIIATFGELLGINYILTPGISGAVTIQSYSRFPTKNLFHIFQSILEINGLTAIKDGDFYRIVPIDTAKTQPMDVNSGKEPQYVLDATFVTQVIPLENVKASEVSSILREIMPRGTNLIVYEQSNLLIVTALPHTLEKFMKIIDALDVDSMESASVKTFVYHVENGNAKKLEDILKTVYLSTKGSATSSARQSLPGSKAPKPIIAQKGANLPGNLGDITISAYEDINALLIKSSPRSYLSLLKVLKNIDVPPKQVLIEVMIAEVTLGNETSYGIEWMAKFNSGNYVGMNPGNFISDTGTLLQPTGVSIPAGEFTAVSSGTLNKGAYVSLFTAIAKENDLNVLASPNILAMDNKEAEIKIGNEVPTATSTTQSTEGITTSSQIQYKTVGTILTVTPHITEKGNVSMKIVVESSDIGVSTTIGTGTYPSFITRKATTNAVVKDSHTLFIGGLISEKKSASQSGIPFLSKIPILGYLFGGRSWKHEKTEMFVMVTPHVINNTAEADKLTGEFNNRVSVIKEKIFKIKQARDQGIDPQETMDDEPQGVDEPEISGSPGDTDSQAPAEKPETMEAIIPQG